MRKSILTIILLLMTSVITIKAGWGEALKTEPVYDTVITISNGIILYNRDYLYTIVYCGGIWIYCSADAPYKVDINNILKQ